jgi:hypothetical protein
MNTDVNYVCVLECKKQSPTSYFVLGHCASQVECADQLVWSKDRWPLAVLCDGCRQLFEYSEGDIRKVSVDSMDRETLLPKRIWYIEVQCAQESCGSLTKMHFQAGIGSLTEHVLGKIRGTPISCRECGQTNRIEDRFCKNVHVVGSSGSS